MRLLSLFLMLGLVGLLVGCDPVEVEPYANAWNPATSPEAWSPPSDNEAPGGVITVTGRLFPLANPVEIYWNGDLSQEACGMVHIESSGSEPVRIHGLSVEGAGLHAPGLDELQADLPWTIGGPEGIGAGFGTWVCYDPQGGALASGVFVVHTKDPTSPTLRVPVVLVDEPTAQDTDPSYPDTVGRLLPWVGPIRFSVGDAGVTIEVDVKKMGEEVIRVTAVETLTPNTHVDSVREREGPGWEVPLPHLMSVGFSEEMTIAVRYDPVESSPPDDALLIAFDDQGEDFYHLVIPIIIR